jgi:hypothetical protein
MITEWRFWSHQVFYWCAFEVAHTKKLFELARQALGWKITEGAYLRILSWKTQDLHKGFTAGHSLGRGYSIYIIYEHGHL